MCFLCARRFFLSFFSLSFILLSMSFLSEENGVTHCHQQNTWAEMAFILFIFQTICNLFLFLFCLFVFFFGCVLVRSLEAMVLNFFLCCDVFFALFSFSPSTQLKIFTIPSIHINSCTEHFYSRLKNYIRCMNFVADTCCWSFF